MLIDTSYEYQQQLKSQEADETDEKVDQLTLMENTIVRQKTAYKELERLFKEKQKQLDDMKSNFLRQSSEIDELNRKLSINSKHQEIQTIIDKLSSKFLTDSVELDFSYSQQQLIRQLFGDMATKGYKEKIKLQQAQIQALQNEIDEREEQFLHICKQNRDLKTFLGRLKS